ncbi:MAG: aminotransferase class I/II-fold pyridoxal phosphate-dependent enzyme [bacterium]|nr:aminotransferase class I/II-fold pyridoxal phosphate-dependent enzyme [bacterium]
MTVNYAETFKKLPPYLFAEIDKKKKELLDKGVDIINFGIGDPDLPTPKFILDAMKKALNNPAYHQYPFGKGLKIFRNAVTNWYQHRFNVNLSPENEIHALIGSKEGITHLALAYVNPGEIVLCPEPGYPAYASSTWINHGEVHFMPLTEKNNFFPDFSQISSDILKKAKVMFLNSPNNPTSQVYTEEQFKKAIAFAKKNNIVLAHDAAYTEMYYDGKPPISFLEVEGAKEVGVEFHSLSKTYNMTGWRIAFVVGNPDIIAGLARIKDNFDSGVFSAIQEAAAIAMNNGDSECKKMREIYQKRRDLFVSEMQKMGWEVNIPEATFYVWAKTPNKISSSECAGKLLEECGIVVTPGNGFGPSGEGYIRFALTVNENRIMQAIARMKKLKF